MVGPRQLQVMLSQQEGHPQPWVSSEQCRSSPLPCTCSGLSPLSQGPLH